MLPTPTPSNDGSPSTVIEAASCRHPESCVGYLYTRSGPSQASGMLSDLCAWHSFSCGEHLSAAVF